MLTFSSPSLDRTPIEMLAVPASQDIDLHAIPALQALTASAMEMEEFTADKDQNILLYNPAGTKIRRCLIVGLGSKERIDAEALRIFAARAVKAALTAKRKRLLIAVPNAATQTSLPGVFAGGDTKRGASLIVWAIAEGRKMATGINQYLQAGKSAKAAVK